MVIRPRSYGSGAPSADNEVQGARFTLSPGVHQQQPVGDQLARDEGECRVGAANTGIDRERPRQTQRATRLPQSATGSRPLDCAPSSVGADDAIEWRSFHDLKGLGFARRSVARPALRNRGRTGRAGHGAVAAADRSRARGRRRERRRAHRSAAGSRRAAHSHRLRRRHEHGRARRRDVRDRHASRGDRARGARDRLGSGRSAARAGATACRSSASSRR